MVSFNSVPFWENTGAVFHSGRVGILCNQTAWHPETGEYLFETFYRRGILARLFMPEHGLFGELQDQLKINDTAIYGELGFKDCEFVSLYGSDESSLSAQPEKLKDLDVLVVELQDVGTRYYTFLSTLRNLFVTLKKENIPLPVWVIDRENPAGSFVEGSPLSREYASFIGIEGLPHRYGLTIGELARYFYSELEADFPLNVVSWKAERKIFPWTIPPSPNIPGLFTSHFYSGQCLWEGTNVSEGRGTTRPFEVFGAPWMETLNGYNRRVGLRNWNDPAHPLFDSATALHWHRFIPVFHKYGDECCFGFQLIRQNTGMAYHALLHGLRLVRFVKENCEGFEFKPGKYESGNDKSAIELLTGDPLILNYLKGEGTEIYELKDHFLKCEKKWIEKTKRFRFYDEPLESVLRNNSVGDLAP